MGRFSRVKGGHGSGKKSEAPDLEAHFSDGAWYDILLRTADPSKNRFLVQARDFPDEEEWVEADRIRLQSQPFEDLPKEGLVVLALHRSARSDLFFEGVVTDSGHSSYCKVRFTEGRAKGQSIKCELDDVNKIHAKRCTPEELRRWCPRKESAKEKKDAEGKSGGGGQVVSFEMGSFVLIEGPDDSCWVAQLLEPYTGKLSEEVDDVDDDGPRISLRWLYTPDELPSNVLKGQAVDNEHEVFLSFHKDTIDARLIKGKCSCVFGFKRPRTNFKWTKDAMFSCRTWDPVKKKISPMDCPMLCTEFRHEIDRLIDAYPFPESCREKDEREVKGGSQSRVSAENAGGGNLREGSRRISDEGNHCAAASDAMETDVKRGRKGRPSTDAAPDRRGTAFKGDAKAEEQAVAEGETGGERRKSSRGSGVGESCGGSEGVSNEVDILSKRPGKAHTVAGEADDARDDFREAKAERKARTSKGHEAAQPDAKVEAKRETREVKEVKEESRKTKRKSENGDLKLEKGMDSTDGPMEEEVKEEGKDEVERKAEEEEEKQEKRGKKGKKEKREEKEREAICADAADSVDRSSAENEKVQGAGHGAKTVKESLKEGNDASEMKDAGHQGKKDSDNPMTPRLPLAGEKGDEAQPKEKEGKEKEKKRSSKGASELAALQADATKSDMLSSITDTGKRRCMPATYFTYDDTGNQAEIAKANIKGPVLKSPDKLDGHRGKTRELAGLGVEPTRAGRRAVLDALEDPPRRERQVPDRFDSIAAPKAKKPKPTPPQAKTSAASRRSVNGKEANGGEDDGGIDNAPANRSASPVLRGKNDKATAASRVEAHESSENGHGGRSRGGKKGAQQKEDEEEVAMDDANEPRVGARATRKRGSRDDEATVEAETEAEGAAGPSKKRGRGGKKDRGSESAIEGPPKGAAQPAGGDGGLGDGKATPQQRADGDAQSGSKKDDINESSKCKPGQDEPEGEEGAEHVRSKDKADDEMEDEDDEEDEGVGIVELRDDALTGEAIWQFEDRGIGTEEDAVKGFVVETLRQVCADFLVRREYKGMAYFLHPEGETQRAVSSVDVARGFRRKGVHQQCVEYLKAYAVEKQAMAMMLVVEDTEVHYPRMRSQVTKSVSAVTETSSTIAPMHRGLLIQLETEEQRRLWHVIYLQSSEPQAASKDQQKHSSADDKDMAKEDDQDAKAAGVDSMAEPKEAKEEGACPKSENKARSLSMRELDIDRCRIMTSIMPPKDAAQETAKETVEEVPKQPEHEDAA